MAGGALHIDVRAIQREAAQAVVEGGVFPVTGVVASLTGRAILPLVGIIGLMAGETVFGRACVALGMAAFTFHTHMLALEREITQAVIKFSWLPGFGAVANTALRAKFAVVGIVF